MRNIIRYSVIAIIVFTAVIATSCKKDKDEDATPTITQSNIIGTWQMIDGDYTGTISFNDDLSGKDYFVDGSMSGTATHTWRLEGDQISITIGLAEGDYEEYNEREQGGTITAGVESAGNELTFNYEGEAYVYTRVADENIVDENDVIGSWQFTEGDYRGVISFNLSENIYNDAAECFVASNDSGAASFVWDINGNMFMISYQNSRLIGDYATYNEVTNGDIRVGSISATETQLTFTVDGESYVYTKMTSSNLVNQTDLDETYWQVTDGTFTSVINFINSEVSKSGSGSDAFVDGNFAGTAHGFSWIVSGDLMSIQYGSLYGDYGNYYEVTEFGSITLPVSMASNQLTFSTGDGDISYSLQTNPEIISESSLLGSWGFTDGTYTDTITFNDDASALDSFLDTDGNQWGASDLYWFVHANFLTVEHLTMTGNYESYNSIIPYSSSTSVISLSGNELTVTQDGEDYIYTKSSK